MHLNRATALSQLCGVPPQLTEFVRAHSEDLFTARAEQEGVLNAARHLANTQLFLHKLRKSS